MRPLYVTSGEPAGIGPDICLDLAQRQDIRPLVILADPELLAHRAELLGLSVKLTPYHAQTQPSAVGELYVEAVELNQQVMHGQLNKHNAGYVIEQLRRSAEYAMKKHSVGVVTAPVQKSVINDAGIQFSGHTEYFQQLAAVPRVVMMLATRSLRVALVTTHLPLRDVAATITAERLGQVLDILIADLKTKFKISKPRILVCGLNPHAGENGYLGDEEIRTINPVLSEYRQRGHDLSMAMPADTLFTPDHLANADAVLAMYHDQGLPVLKALGFGEAINITLGLPFIRTSVDHGTALEIAASGRAKSGSLHVAVDTALALAE